MKLFLGNTVNSPLQKNAPFSPFKQSQKPLRICLIRGGLACYQAENRLTKRKDRVCVGAEENQSLVDFATTMRYCNTHLPESFWYCSCLLPSSVSFRSPPSPKGEGFRSPGINELIKRQSPDRISGQVIDYSITLRSAKRFSASAPPLHESLYPEAEWCRRRHPA